MSRLKLQTGSPQPWDGRGRWGHLEGGKRPVNSAILLIPLLRRALLPPEVALLGDGELGAFSRSETHGLVSSDEKKCW